MKGVQVVGAAHDGVARAYTSHWVCQVSFEEPIVMASVSPKHDTHPTNRLRAGAPGLSGGVTGPRRRFAPRLPAAWGEASGVAETHHIVDCVPETVQFEITRDAIGR